MIKSDKETKNNGIRHSNLSKLLSNANLRISFQDWQSYLKEKDTTLEGFEPQSKVRIQVRCDLH